jgi:hypothetical protein
VGKDFGDTALARFRKVGRHRGVIDACRDQAAAGGEEIKFRGRT